MKRIFNIRTLIVILLLIICSWYGYFFVKNFFQEKAPHPLPSNYGPDRSQKAEKEKVPQKISQKNRNLFSKEDQNPEEKMAQSPKKKTLRKVDFILISPNPIGIRLGYQITIQAFGFQFKDTRESPPQDADPLLSENQKNLKGKYHCLGPVAVRWENLSLRNPPSRNSCAFKVIPQKDLSKATVIPLSIGKFRGPGIMATLRDNPLVKAQGEVVIRIFQIVPKYVPQKPIKKHEIKLARDAFFEFWGEQDGKIYGRVFMKEGSLKIYTGRKTTWDKKFLLRALNLQNHEAFLEELKNTLWKRTHRFINYRFYLAMERYKTLESGGKIDLKQEQYELEKYLKEEEASLPPQISPEEERTRREFERAISEQDASSLMKFVKSQHSYTGELFRLAGRDKTIRNLMAFPLRDFVNHYPKPKQYDSFYAELLYTLTRMGVATPEEEQWVIQDWKRSGGETPPGWETRHTWWRD